MGKSWKTTLCGILFGVASALSTGTVASTPQVQKISAGVTAVAGVLLGLFGKDFNVTGGGGTNAAGGK